MYYHLFIISQTMTPGSWFRISISESSHTRGQHLQHLQRFLDFLRGAILALTTLGPAACGAVVDSVGNGGVPALGLIVIASCSNRTIR